MKEVESKLLMHLTKRFPQLATVSVAYKWSGVVAFNMDFHPSIGKAATDECDYEILYSAGYSAYGIAASIYYGKLLQELYFGDDSADLKKALEYAEPRWAGPPLMRCIHINRLNMNVKGNNQRSSDQVVLDTKEVLTQELAYATLL
jgi:glycine/D-amino acid oxidase-like deaminating enzyme